MKKQSGVNVSPALLLIFSGSNSKIAPLSLRNCSLNLGPIHNIAKLHLPLTLGMRTIWSKVGVEVL